MIMKFPNNNEKSLEKEMVKLAAVLRQDPEMKEALKKLGINSD